MLDAHLGNWELSGRPIGLYKETLQEEAVRALEITEREIRAHP